MRVHVLQHVPFEDIGSMAPWLAKAGARMTYTRFFENAAFVPVAGLDLVIAMGGPMSANDEAALPWLRAEKAFIRDAASSGVAVLGVCLGAQLVANVFGARVYRSPYKEIGWLPVEASPCTVGAFHFPERLTVFQWHGETFDLPFRAVRLAGSRVCENQAFQIGRKVVGLQFHLEATPQSVNALLDHCGGELTAGPWVQSPSDMRKADGPVYAEINRTMESVLSYLVGADQPAYVRGAGA